jgi:HD superfamily phosphohydrolase YqeK
VTQYYFDFLDGDEYLVDEEGLELRSMHAVQDEAVRALAGLAHDTLRELHETKSREIEVRDQTGPIMTVRFHFEIALGR